MAFGFFPGGMGPKKENLFDFSESDNKKSQKKKEEKKVRSIWHSGSVWFSINAAAKSSKVLEGIMTSWPLQIRGTEKVSSWLLWCLFKEPPVFVLHFIWAAEWLLESTWLMWSHLSGCHALLMSRYFIDSLFLGWGSVCLVSTAHKKSISSLREQTPEQWPQCWSSKCRFKHQGPIR